MIPNENELTQTLVKIRQCTTRLAHEGAYWEEPEKEKLSRMFYSGVGISEIAVELQRTEPAIFQQIEKMDLYQRKENPQRKKYASRQPGCLCKSCQLYPDACLRCMHSITSEEGA